MTANNSISEPDRKAKKLEYQRRYRERHREYLACKTRDRYYADPEYRRKSHERAARATNARNHRLQRERLAHDAAYERARAENGILVAEGERFKQWVMDENGDYEPPPPDDYAELEAEYLESECD